MGVANAASERAELVNGWRFSAGGLICNIGSGHHPVLDLLGGSAALPGGAAAAEDPRGSGAEAVSLSGCGDERVGGSAQFLARRN